MDVMISHTLCFTKVLFIYFSLEVRYSRCCTVLSSNLYRTVTLRYGKL